jgi:hypothetical protein
MTLLAWVTMLVLVFASLMMSKNRFKLSLYFIMLASLTGSLLLAEEQYQALTYSMLKLTMVQFFVAFAVVSLAGAVVLSQLHRGELQHVLDGIDSQAEAELEPQPAI